MLVSQASAWLYRRMGFSESFYYYNAETHGDLTQYLQEREDSLADGIFRGPEPYEAMRRKGLLIPNVSVVRINCSPAPDIGLFVNEDFQLESRGGGAYNMSLIAAEPGVYEPQEVLRDRLWSILSPLLPME